MVVKLVIFSLLSIMLGVVLTLIVVRHRSAGTLKVYIPDDQDESPYLYVELDRSVESICKNKQVLFRVDMRNIRSQK